MNPAVLRWLPLPVLLVGSLAGWGLARGRAPVQATAPDTRPPAVEVIELVPEPVRLTVRTHGVVEPRTEIDLVAEISGRVQSLSPALAAGGVFGAGDVLVQLDPVDAELAVERAEAARVRSESQAHLARARRARLEALARREVASPARLEEAEHEERIAWARLREARAARDEARRDLERTVVRAPFVGRVRAKHVDAGQFVARGTPLARIYATDHAEVRLPLPTAQLAYLELEHLDVGDGPAVLLRAHYAGRQATWPARIVRAEGEIAARSRMLHLVARVEGGGKVTPGLFVEAEILGRRFERVFVLPRAALRPPAEVLVVDSASRLRPRQVHVLRIEDERVLVQSGLSAGERVAAFALDTASGSRVRPVVSARPDRPVVSAGPAP